MKNKPFPICKSIKIYDILIKYAKAPSSMKGAFIHHHSEIDDRCDEWRFQGILGNGGKYLSSRNIVTSDFTDKESETIITIINRELKKITE